MDVSYSVREGVSFRNMINRLLIRTRVMQVAYAHYHREQQKLTQAEQELKQSFVRTHDLYLFLLRLIPSLTELHAYRLELRRRKHLATARDLNPNTRLADNALSAQIHNTADLEAWYNAFPLNWQAEEGLLRHLLERIERSELFESYMNAEETNWESDKQFWVDAFHSIIASDLDLAEYLEQQSIYWDDELTATEKIECEEHPAWDQIEEAVEEARQAQQYAAHPLELGAVEIVKDFVVKSLRRATAEDDFSSHLLPLFKDEDDEAFASHLLRQLLLKHTELTELIETHISESWDKERLADLDVLIMSMCIVEFLHFPGIPTHVSINEYVELAKAYSTPKSSSFINGVLDAVARSLKESGRIIKA